MKKTPKIALITVVVILTIYQLLGVFGIFKLYTNPTTANEPNIKYNSKIFVSNLRTPKTKDFVCYKYDDEIFGKQIRTHRLCGIENDIVEIKNGIVYKNGENFDKDLELVHIYKLTLSEYENIKYDEEIPAHLNLSKIDDTNINIQLLSSYASSKGYLNNKIIDSVGKQNQDVKRVFNQNWNKDNFGPAKIPNGKIFVLGDNRDYTLDSRFVGFINESDIIGVVVKKFSL